MIRSAGSGRAGNAAVRRRGDRACEFFLRVRLSQALARGLQAAFLVAKQPFLLRARVRRRGRPQRIHSLGTACGAAGSDRGPTVIVQAQGSGRRTGIAAPIRPTVCQKQIAQPPLPVSLYKPLVFRRFRAGARWRAAVSAAGSRADGHMRPGHGATARGAKKLRCPRRGPAGMLTIRSGPRSAPTASVRSR